MTGKQSADAPKEMSWREYHDAIEALKEERGARWRAHVPDDVQEGSELERQIAVLTAENAVDALKLDGEIKILRARQMALGPEPPVDPGLTEEESDRSHILHGHAPRFGHYLQADDGQFYHRASGAHVSEPLPTDESEV